MTFGTKQRIDFAAAVNALFETAPGKAATMCTVPRDLLVDILGYPKTSIVVDTAGVRDPARSASLRPWQARKEAENQVISASAYGPS